MASIFLCFSEKDRDEAIAKGGKYLSEKLISGKKCWEIFSEDGSLEKFVEDKKHISFEQFVSL
jgi:hypothetical protein